MPFTDDTWIANNSPIEPEKLHALGLIQFRWNSCELMMRLVLCSLEGRKFTETWAEHYDSRPKELTNQIRKFAINGKHSAEIKDRVLHAIELYNVNRMNRNQLSHFLSNRTHDRIEFRNNKNPDYQAIFRGPAVPSELKELRQVADEITQAMRYLTSLANFLGAQNYASPFPLPEKPPVPENRSKPRHP